MDSNSTPKRLPAEEGKKSGNEGFQEKGQAGSEALSLLQLSEKLDDFLESQTKDDLLTWIEMDRKRMRLPEVSGFRMARRV